MGLVQEHKDFENKKKSHLKWHCGSRPAWLMGREPARHISVLSSNPSWDATVHPLCETFNVMRVV